MGRVTAGLPSEPSTPGRGRGRPSTLDRVATLDAAWRVIAERGVDRARYADIATESGTPVSTLQNAFGTLQALLIAAIEHASRRDAEFLDTIPGATTASATERLRAFAGGAVGYAFGADSYLVWLELWRAAARDTELAEHASTAYDRWWGLAESIVEQGQAEGTFTTALPPRDLAVAIVAILDGVALALLLPAHRADAGSAARIALTSIEQMLAVPAA